MNITNDIWNATYHQINEMMIFGTDIISNVLENPTSIEGLNGGWFDSMFNNVKDMYKYVSSMLQHFLQNDFNRFKCSLRGPLGSSPSLGNTSAHFYCRKYLDSLF